MADDKLYRSHKLRVVVRNLFGKGSEVTVYNDEGVRAIEEGGAQSVPSPACTKKTRGIGQLVASRQFRKMGVKVFFLPHRGQLLYNFDRVQKSLIDVVGASRCGDRALADKCKAEDFLQSLIWELIE